MRTRSRSRVMAMQPQGVIWLVTSMLCAATLARAASTTSAPAATSSATVDSGAAKAPASTTAEPAKSTTTSQPSPAAGATKSEPVSKSATTAPKAATPQKAAAGPAAGATSTTAKPAAGATKSAVPGKTMATGASKPGVDPAAKTNARTATTAGSAGAAGTKQSSGAPTAGTPAAATSAAHVDEHVTYHYNTLGRRDPFQSLIDGEFVGADVGGDAPPDVGGLKVVGIVWGDSDKFALVEDGRGNSHVLRQGDKVMNGFVESLKRDGIIVSMTVDGQTESITVPLTRKGDKDATH